MGGRPASLPRPAAARLRRPGDWTAKRPDMRCNEKEEGQEGSFTLPNIWKQKRKEKKYLKWQYNQETLVWSPNFTMSTFEMANMW